MRVTRAFLFFVPVLLAACGEAPGSGSENSIAVGGERATCSGAMLPITGLCTDANPALFLAIDDSLETAASGCVWRTEELRTGADEALVFRAQDCTGEMWDKIAYTWVDRYVKSRPVTVPEDQAMFILEVLDVGPGQTAEEVALRTLSHAPENQRGRCITVAFPGPRVTGPTFQLAPNADLKAELETASSEGPWEVCGPNGIASGTLQFWEDRKSHAALFHIIGQDEPRWDPASFTFYAKKADGAWGKAE